MSTHAGKRSSSPDLAATATGPQAGAVGKQTLVQQQAHGSGVQRRANGGEADSSAVHAAAERGTATASSALPHGDMIQRAFGRHDVSGIQAHTGGEATESAQAMGAQAYATGNHVVLGGSADLHTVAHEAAHVVQQRGGVQLKGGVGAAGDEYEQHADQVADAVVSGGSAEALLDQMAGSGGSSAGGAVQRFATGAAIGAPAFTHVSESGKIVIKSAQEAYASDDMIAAANGGDLAIMFTKGPELEKPPGFADRYPNAGTLYQLMPRMRAPGAGPKPSREAEAAMSHSPVEGDSDEKIAQKHEAFKKYIDVLLGEIKAFVKDIDTAVRNGLGKTIPDENTVVPANLKGTLMSRVTPFIRGPNGQVLGPMLGTAIGGFENLASRTGDAANPLKVVELSAWLGWFNSHYTKEAEKEKETPASALALPNDCGSVSSLVAGKSNMQQHVADDPAIGQTYKANYGDDKGKESWNVHWAAAVMKDGGDTLSLETGVQPGRFAGGKSFWTYSMYGSGGDQTFAAQTDRANDAHIANQQQFNSKAKF
jgi:hypothetical protein